MRTTRFIPLIFFIAVILLPPCAFSQGAKKYQSLLWEITGKGLKHPSYLFGTMHVSSKLVFHLADSFYYALKNVDEVAIELNPEVWQPEMVKLDGLKNNYQSFVQSSPNEYLNERSFKLENYEEELKMALQSEPTVVNNLLYRTYKPQEDFEENTFLDLYIYQTAKKLGKLTTGVEDYVSTEKIVMEAYAAMAEEKKPLYNNAAESPYELEKKSEEAYRRGDLDLLDSLETIMTNSKVFREKFLLERNIIQANSIDTILRKHSLFVGVGAAHLPGDDGVIELLRKKGYKLRPVILNERNAFLQNTIDKQKVQVDFHPFTNPDEAYTVSVPGSLYKMSTDITGPDRYQYADMSNGAYYMITRVQTHSAFKGDPVEKVYKKVDSLLYENIPGKIIEKKLIRIQGYPGFDITNKTRSGDIQRYQIFVTPFEVLVFKMSAKESYTQGPEAEKFFNSIKLPELKYQPVKFEPSPGGFTVNLPMQPHQFLNSDVADDVNRWEYEVTDSVSGNAFLILKKSINNFSFLDEDTFDLDLVNESFKSSKFIRSQINSKYELFKGYPCMNVTLKTEDGNFIKEKIIIKGPQYILLAAKSNDSNQMFSSFFSSFQFTNFKYAPSKPVTDTFLHFTVMTPVAPEIDPVFRSLFESVLKTNTSISSFHSYFPEKKHAFFKSDSTGEIIAVSMEQLPEYYHIKNKTFFNESESDDYLENNDMVLSGADSFIINKNITAWRFIVSDTNTSRCIRHILILDHNRIYRIVAMCDSNGEGSSFLKTFLSTFSPIVDTTHFDAYANKNDLFFSDFYIKDSSRHAKVLEALPEIDFTQRNIPQLMSILQNLNYNNKDYFETKSKVIRALGSINEKGAAPSVVNALNQIYENAGDTLTFQNEVIKALAKNESEESYAALKQLLMQDPPIFESNSDYAEFFDNIRDSLSLAKKLFPEILQLLTIDDYKDNITSLLTTLLDSSLIKPEAYKDYFTKIYFDAKLEMKKQQARDERLLDKSGDDDASSGTHYNYYNFTKSLSNVNDYSKLLIPFYDKDSSVKKFIDKLLHSSDLNVRAKTAVLFLKSHRKVADSILLSIAKSDKNRVDLYEWLQDMHDEAGFPKAYCSHEQMARSILLRDNSYYETDSIQFLYADTIVYNKQPALVYFYKYRMNDNEDWKMAISGTQPIAENKINTSEDLVKLTGERIEPDEDVREQFEKELHKMLITSHKSGKEFYLAHGYDQDDY